MRLCQVSGCQEGVSRFGRYCNAHKTRDRRHGHPTQEGITKAHLKPYLNAARKRIEKNAQPA